MKYYVQIRHPYRTGETITCVPTGKTRAEERNGNTILEAEAICITPKTGIGKLWFSKEEIVTTPNSKHHLESPKPPLI